MNDVSQRIKELREGKEYRPVVCMVVFNRAGKVLLVHSPKRGKVGGFVFPQGGIEEGESPLSTVPRELFEELGIRKRHLEVIEVNLFYRELDVGHQRKERRGFFKGKAYFGVLVQYSGPDKLNANYEEVQEYKWLEPKEAVELSKQTASKEKAELIKEGLEIAQELLKDNST